MDYQAIDESKQYKVYPIRFWIIFLYTLIQMMTSVLMNTLNPIASELSNIYQYHPIIINLGSLLFILMYPIFTFPAAYVIDSKGIKAGIMVGSLLGIIGVTLRLFVNHAFWLVLVGQVLGGMGRPFIINCQAKISGNWFHASKRGGVTQLLTLVLNVSLIIGILIPGIMFKGYKSEVDGVEKGKQLTFKLMLVQAILGYICFLPNIFFQIQKPPTPPSQSGDIKRQPFKKALSKLLRNKNYLFLLIAFGLYFGIFNAISITLSYILQPWFGNNSMAVSLVGGSPIISGILGVIILGPMQRKQRKYKKWILICMLGSCSAILLFYPFLQTNSLGAACFISAYNSFWLIPLVPIMLELGCQLVFPVGEGAAVGLLFAFGNLFGFILGAIMSILVDGESKRSSINGLIFSLSLFVIGLVLILLMKQQKNRERLESQAYQKRKSSLAGSTQSQRIDQKYVTPNFTEINGDTL